MLSLIISDIYRGTDFYDYARGWSRAIFFMSNFLGLYQIGIQRINNLLYWFLGSVFSLLIIYVLNNGLQYFAWKFGFATPIIFFALYLIIKANGKYSTILLISLTILNILLDFRSLGLLIIFTLLFIKLKEKYESVGKAIYLFKRNLVIATTVFLFTFIYIFSQNLISIENPNKLVADRRIGGDSFRIAGLLVGLKAISESPLIGLGSWARSDKLFSEWVYLQYEYGGSWTPSAGLDYFFNMPEANSIQVHSQIVQAWIEAGIFGFVFFVFQATFLLTSLRVIFRNRFQDKVYILIVFLIFNTLWAILFSPFGGGARILNALTFAFIFIYFNNHHRLMEPAN
ncbi:MAG: O-antigen ligase family protein [Elusimicrobiota bacterium]